MVQVFCRAHVQCDTLLDGFLGFCLPLIEFTRNLCKPNFKLLNNPFLKQMPGIEWYFRNHPQNYHTLDICRTCEPCLARGKDDSPKPQLMAGSIFLRGWYAIPTVGADSRNRWYMILGKL